MIHRPWRRAATSVAGALLLTAGLVAGAPGAAAGTGTAQVRAVFPTDALTVPDGRQATGRRVALPSDGCSAPLECDLVRRLNQLDGFDLDPRLAVTFSRDVDPGELAGLLSVRDARGRRIGVDRVVYDPATSTVFAHPAEQLAPATTYRLVVEPGSRSGGGGTTFTTLSATDGLADLQRQIEDGRAMRVAGVRPGLRVEGVVPVGGTTGTEVRWWPDSGPGANTLPTARLPEGSRMVVGSFRAPNWLQADGTIRQTPTGDDGPLPISAERLPFLAFLPPGQPPEGGWPVAVFGHGLRTSTDLPAHLATENAAQGIATIGTNVVGHGGGPRSAWEVVSGGSTALLPAYGRGVDQDDDGTIDPGEGSTATGAAAAVLSRDALRQTTADVMILVRSLEGTDVDGDGGADLSGRDVTYIGQSFGGIYGTMLAAVDPAVARAVLDVAGGPPLELVRLAEPFRPDLVSLLADWGVLEAGALEVQDLLARLTWLGRPGSPEAFAPLLDPGRVLVRVAFGDATVPNPTSYTLIDAGDLWDRTVVYRNDRTPQAAEDPHAFMLGFGGFRAAADRALVQATAFLGDGLTTDPDGAGDVWEVPVVDPGTLRALDLGRPPRR